LYIIDLHAPNLWRTSDNPSKPYTATLNIILNHFNLAMKLANLTWNDNIFVWRCEFKNNHPRSKDCEKLICSLSFLNSHLILSTTNKHSLFFHRKLAGFLVYNFIKSWNGERLTL